MILDPAFVRDHWLRREPAILRGAVPRASRARAGIADALSACAEPVKADLYSGSDSPGTADRLRLQRTHEAPALFRRILSRGSGQILYLFGLAAAAPGFAALQDMLRFGFDWRFYDQLASLATPGSVIRIHVDLIDTLIVQLEGARRWQVWPMDGDLARLVALNDGGDVGRMAPSGQPIIDAELQPGDVIYIPALLPHQAVLATDAAPSLSLSVGWAALTPIRLLRAAIDPARRAALEEAYGAAPRAFTALVDDPMSGDPLEHLASRLVDMLAPPQRVGLDAEAIIRGLRAVSLGSLAGSAAKGSLASWRASLQAS